MPPEFLLPLFVLTLVANAFLVVGAIRDIRRSSLDRNGQGPGGRPRGNGGSASAAGAAPATEQGKGAGSAGSPLAQATAAGRLVDRRAASDSPAPVLAQAASRRAAAVPPTPATAERQPDPVPATASTEPGPKPARPEPQPALAAKRPPKRTRTTRPAIGADDGGGGSALAEPRRRTRRRFSLPPLDDDHERVNRSIETFLGGVEATVDGSVGETPRSATGPTTIALVAVDGLPDPAAIRAASARRTPSQAVAANAEADHAADIQAMIERTLRGAARGSDVVTIAPHGRFQVVLNATGELAARAYLRRVRATVEPLLEANDWPLRLTVATATVLDGSIEEAVRQAEVRLGAARDAFRGAAAGQGGQGAAHQPRAAAD